MEMQEILNDIRERLVRVETKIDDSLIKRVNKLEGNQDWLWRTVIAGFIAAAIAYLTKLK
jgi:hypothetical protein